ncbi:MAG TPA: MBL fold metallo-hydrolase [Bacteroidales bacterium]|nr:MBL fold metallo-hydrolase [Bacteroidales bacterium]
MTISVLTDNHPGSHTPAEHGLSYLIEYDGKRLLFDTGQGDMFLRNAEAMKISMTNIDMVILSHGHFDHGNGLGYLSGSRMICHPGCFVKRYRKSDHTYIGLKNSKEELSLLFSLITSAEPYKISEKIFFLGEIPRLTGFESRTTSFIFEDGMPDYVMDDSAITLILPEGLFVVTGCGHSGIVNTLEYAKKVTGINRLYGIMGGFHLKEINHQTKETIRYIKENKLKHVLPSHCTDLPALSAFYESFGMALVKTGNIYNF